MPADDATVDVTVDVTAGLLHRWPLLSQRASRTFKMTTMILTIMRTQARHLLGRHPHLHCLHRDPQQVRLAHLRLHLHRRRLVLRQADPIPKAPSAACSIQRALRHLHLLHLQHLNHLPQQWANLHPPYSALMLHLTRSPMAVEMLRETTEQAR